MKHYQQLIVRRCLLVVGIVCACVAFGEPLPDTTFRQWLFCFLLFFAFSAVCLGILRRLDREKQNTKKHDNKKKVDYGDEKM